MHNLTETLQDKVWSLGIASFNEGLALNTEFAIVVHIASNTSIEVFKNKKYQPEISNCINTADGLKDLLASTQIRKEQRYKETDPSRSLGRYGK